MSCLSRALGRIAKGEPLTKLGLNCLSALEQHYRSRDPVACDLVRLELLSRNSR